MRRRARRAGATGRLVAVTDRTQLPTIGITQQPDQFALRSGGTTRALLEETQRFLFPGADLPSPTVILAAFSNGNTVLADVLNANLAANTKSADHRFVTESVAELYSFDPPPGDGGNYAINTMVAWRAKNTRDKIVRLYAQYFHDRGYAKLLPVGAKSGLKKGSTFFGQSSGSDVTLLYVPVRSDKKDAWAKTSVALFPGETPKISTENVHHWLPAVCLTDALRRSRSAPAMP